MTNSALSIIVCMYTNSAFSIVPDESVSTMSNNTPRTSALAHSFDSALFACDAKYDSLDVASEGSMPSSDAASEGSMPTSVRSMSRWYPTAAVR